MQEKIENEIDDIFTELKDLNESIFAEPEIGEKEFKSSQAHIQFLRRHGFQVESQYLGIPTAFKATLNGHKPGPCIAYLAEYDALPEIGHGCGHNLLGTVSSGAGVVLGRLLPEIGGRVVVLGTPAEETNGFKVDMVDQGTFDEIDIVMIAHPGTRHRRSGRSLAMEALEFRFLGKSAHAAENPEDGINALDAAINMFNNINALREHIKPEGRVHGIIKEGGVAANIVPDLAVAHFYIRAVSKKYLKELVQKVMNCAEGASLAAGTRLQVQPYEKSYDNMVTNNTLSETYSRNLLNMGAEMIEENSANELGSIDTGNVSHRCPTIHPYFGITDKNLSKHTREFANATITPLAYQEMKKTIGALVLTGSDIILNPDLLKTIKAEFDVTEK